MGLTWRRKSTPIPVTQVFVLCERGVPVVVCADRPAAHLEAAGHDQTRTRIFEVPLVASIPIVSVPED